MKRRLRRRFGVYMTLHVEPKKMVGRWFWPWDVKKAARGGWCRGTPWIEEWNA